MYWCGELPGSVIQRRDVGFSIVFELIERITNDGTKQCKRRHKFDKLGNANKPDVMHK